MKQSEWSNSYNPLQSRSRNFYDDDEDIYESEPEHEEPYHEDGTDYDFDYGRANNRLYEHGFMQSLPSSYQILRPKDNREGFFREEE